MPEQLRHGRAAEARPRRLRVVVRRPAAPLHSRIPESEGIHRTRTRPLRTCSTHCPIHLPFCAAFLFLVCNAAIPPSRYALTQLWTAPTPAPSRSAARFCCMLPGTGSTALVLCLRWNDGLGHMAGIPGIRRQPVFQALAWSDNPGALYHLGRCHRRGEVQLHRALPFFGTEHTKILSLSLQENVRSPLSKQSLGWIHSWYNTDKVREWLHLYL